MNKQDLVAVVADAGDISKAKAGDVVDAIFDAVEKALKKKDGEVRLVGFGTFSTSKRKAGKGATRAPARKSRSLPAPPSASKPASRSRMQ